VTVANVGWLAALVKQRVVPVVSALVDEPDGPREVWAADVAVALADALAASFDPVLCALTTGDQPGLVTADGRLDEAPVDALADDVVPDVAAVRRLHEGAVPVLVTNLQGLLGGPDVTGTTLTETL